MKTIDKLHMIHRFWRYRLRTERSSLAYLLRLPLAGQVVIDVGANLGIYSYWMSKTAGPAGRVIAFEPQPELARHLAEMKSAFELPNLEIVNKALSSSAGSRMLFRPEPGYGGASLRRLRPSWEPIEVEVTTLDEYYVDSTPVRFIKCDTEGHEYEVLRGSRRILARDRPTLLLEIHDPEAAKGEIPKYLGELGYQGFFFHRGQRIDFARSLEFPHRKPWEYYRNYVFLPRGLDQR
jgi:FkbM family methyltransferase